MEKQQTIAATPGSRFVASLIDGLIIIPFLMVPVLGQIIAIAYILTKDALPFLDGQSIGKKVMKIRVVLEDSGFHITNNYGAAVVRQASLMIPLFNLVDALMAFSSDRKRFGDHWAKTIVIQ